MSRFRALLAAVVAATSLLATLAPVALADYAEPTFVDVDVSGLQVTVTGTYDWRSRLVCDPTTRYAGWAVAWNDPADPGNPIDDSGIRVGTATDNSVHTNGDCGTVVNGVLEGTFGPLTHTYSQPGTYRICVILYDIHTGEEDIPFRHNRIAAGPERNRDNTVDRNGESLAAQCPSVVIDVGTSDDGPVAAGGSRESPDDAAGGVGALPPGAAPYEGLGLLIVLVPLGLLFVAGLLLILIARRRRDRGPEGVAGDLIGGPAAAD